MTQEFDFFGNPQVSKLFDLILELGMDLHVANTRIRALEMQLVRNGDLKAGEIDSFRPTDSEKVVLDKTRDEFMDRLMRIRFANSGMLQLLSAAQAITSSSNHG